MRNCSAEKNKSKNSPEIRRASRAPLCSTSSRKERDTDRISVGDLMWGSWKQGERIHRAQASGKQEDGLMDWPMKVAPGCIKSSKILSHFLLNVPWEGNAETFES